DDPVKNRVSVFQSVAHVEEEHAMQMRNPAPLPLSDPVEPDQAKPLQAADEGVTQGMPIVRGFGTVTNCPGEGEAKTSQALILDGLEELSIPSRGFGRPTGDSAPLMLGRWYTRRCTRLVAM